MSDTVPSLAGLIAAAASVVPATQARLDEDYRRRALRFALETARAARAGEPADEIVTAAAAALAPELYAVRYQEVTLSLELVQRRDAEFSVGLRVGGRPVSLFYAARYSTRQSNLTRITVTTVNSGPSPAAPSGAAGS